jgi:CRP/FNR family transcriptional regulator, cyclic AMP receptor protein
MLTMDTTRLFRNADNAITPETDHIIFRENDPGDLMYVVLEGEVEILVGEKSVETIGVGGIFGEMALIDDGPRSATARAKTACKLVPVTPKRFMFLVEQTPFFAIHVMKLMSERMRRMNRTLVAGQ